MATVPSTPDPDATQLAEVAMQSADSAKAFGIPAESGHDLLLHRHIRCWR